MSDKNLDFTYLGHYDNDILKMHGGHGGNDEDSDRPDIRHVHRGDEESDEENSDINEINKATIKISRVQDTSATVSSDIINMNGIPVTVNIEGSYAKEGSYDSCLENKTGTRIPKFGYFAERGTGRVSAEVYSLLEANADAKGPNSSYSVAASPDGVEAIARAEIGSASAKAGPVGVKVGLGFDTGASVGVDGVEAKFLGTGFTIGPKTSISVLGSEASCSVM